MGTPRAARRRSNRSAIRRVPARSPQGSRALGRSERTAASMASRTCCSPGVEAPPERAAVAPGRDPAVEGVTVVGPGLDGAGDDGHVDPDAAVAESDPEAAVAVDPVAEHWRERGATAGRPARWGILRGCLMGRKSMGWPIWRLMARRREFRRGCRRQVVRRGLD